MPKVPYQPYSEVAPSGANVGIATPPEAFGAGIARATAGLGGEIEQAGDKLFNRALAFQQLQNETEAEQANLKLMSGAGDLHANYNALTGEDRVKAFPKYKEDLLKLQSDIRAGMSNDMARKMFDRPSLNTIGHSIFNGAGAAATAQRDWSSTTAKSTMDMAVKTISDDPLNDVLFARKATEIRAAAAKVAQLDHGAAPDSPIAQDIAMKGVSTAARERIISVAHVDPWRAGEMQEDAVKNKQLTSADNNAVDNAIKSQRLSIGAANIVDEVYDPTKSVKQMENEVREKSAALSKDPLLPIHAEHALKSRITTDNYIKKQEEAGNKETIIGGILAGAKNERELYANPKMAAARDALPDSAWKVGIPAMIERYNAAKNKDTNRDNWIELEGMRTTNPIKFLNTDVTKMQLSDGDMKHFIKEQQKVREAPQSDPRVQQFIGWMRPLMGAEMRGAGVYSPPTKAEGAGAGSDYDLFAGTVSVGIEEYIKEHGKPPRGTEAVKEIGMNALRKISEPGWLFGTNETPYFKKALGKEYESFKKAITQESIDKGEGIPSEEQTERAYRQMDYQRFYGKKKPSGQ